MFWNKAKASYYTQLIDNVRGNNSLWKHLNNLTNKTIKQKGIKELTVDGKNIDDSAIMANTFNCHFIQSVEELTKDFTPVEHVNPPSQMASENTFYIK